MSVRSRRDTRALLISAFLCGGLSALSASCQTEELRLFDPLRGGSPDAAVVAPQDVVPRAINDRGPDTAAAPAAPDDAGTSPMPAPAPDLQPACEADSAACRSCIAAQRCAAPEVCHPSSGNCVAACPRGTDAECTTARAPLCNPTYRVCVLCVDDSDCSGGTPACNSAAGVCVECLTDRHCTLGGNSSLPHCDSAAQSCRECVVNADCSNGLVCKVSEGHCDDSGGSGSGGNSGGSDDKSGGAGDDSGGAGHD